MRRIPAPRRSPPWCGLLRKRNCRDRFGVHKTKGAQVPKEPARPRLSFGSPQELAPYACRAGCRASQGLFPQPLLISCYSDVKASRSGSPCFGRSLGLASEIISFRCGIVNGWTLHTSGSLGNLCPFALCCVKRRGRRGSAGRAEWAKAACRSGSRAPNPPAP